MTGSKPENPLIVQGDHTILAEVASPHYAAARDGLSRFAELVKAPEHVHTYRITPLSIWNACAAGISTEEIAGTLGRFSKYPVPEHVLLEIRDYGSRYGRVKLLRDERGLVLVANDPALAEQIARSKQVAPWLGSRLSALEFGVAPAARGEIKQALIKIGFPAEDLAGYSEGEPLPMSLRELTQSAHPFSLRPYQQEAAAAFHAAGTARGGSGVITLPCGAGKTIVAMASLRRIGGLAVGQSPRHRRRPTADHGYDQVRHVMLPAVVVDVAGRLLGRMVAVRLGLVDAGVGFGSVRKPRDGQPLNWVPFDRAGRESDLVRHLPGLAGQPISGFAAHLAGEVQRGNAYRQADEPRAPTLSRPGRQRCCQDCDQVVLEHGLFKRDSICHAKTSKRSTTIHFPQTLRVKVAAVAAGAILARILNDWDQYAFGWPESTLA